MLKNIAAHDSKESVIFFLQLLAIRVFDGFDELIIECLIHNNPILIFYVLCHVEAGVVIGGPQWRLMAQWGILPGWAGCPTLWLRG